MNNPSGTDSARPGGVPRASLSALSPTTGMPLAWNPGRHPRGIGIQVLYPTSTGLWMGSDTDWVGNFEYKRPKLAFFPLAGGSGVVPETTRQLPGGLYQGVGTTLTSRAYDGSTVAAPVTVPSPVSWAGVRAATLVGTALFYARTDDKLYRRTYDGKTFGPETLVDPYNDPKWANQATGSGTSLYRGMTPWQAGELANVDSMWFADGRLFYVLHNSSALYSRAFSPDSGIAHATRVQALGVSLTSTAGGFVAGGNLYLASAGTGNLSRTAWVSGAPSGASTLVSGPATGVDYRGTVLFFGSAYAANSAPTAAITANCSNSDCTYDAAGSADVDGAVTSYAWTFGDGATATGPTAAHQYAAPGTYPVTLTVTDNDGATGSASRDLVVSPPPASPITFRGAAGRTATFTSVTVTTPAAVQAGDAMALLVTTATPATVTPPAGWAPVTSVTATDQTTTVYSKTAAASDAGAAVKVILGATVKVTAQLVAYGGASATTPISAVTAAVTGDSTTWTAPAAPVGADGGWAVWYWAAKSSTSLTWAGPAGSTARDAQAGAGTGNVGSVIADSGVGRPAGTVPPALATTSAAATRGTAVTLVIAPAP
jgi:PKD repeat protein